MKVSSKREIRGRLRSGLLQAAGILLAGSLLGGGINIIRPGGLPWKGSWSTEAVSVRHLQGLPEISLEEAWRLYQEGRSLFLDARDRGSFDLGHLPGALNVVPEEAADFAEEIRSLSESGLVPIAYCDGAACPLSSQLARRLRAMGLKSVCILVDGWGRWRRAGFPVERGE